MKITDIRLGKLAIPLKKPFKTALRVAKEVVTNIVVVETDASLAGYGEAPPTAVITGDSSPLMMSRTILSISSWKISRCSMVRCSASWGVMGMARLL